MRRLNLGRSGLAVCSTLSLALAMASSGCLSDDTSLTNPTPHLDASFIDTGLPDFDASGMVTPDSSVTPPADAAIDSALPPVVVDAGHEAGISQIGLVTGSTLSRSTHYQMVGTSGPATAPVQKSPKYTLVGGMGVSTETP